MKTFYDVLAVNEDATNEEIEIAYKKQKLKLKNELTGKELNEIDKKRVREVEAAFKILTDSEKRTEYDKNLVIARNNQLLNKLSSNTQKYNEEQARKEQQQKKQEEQLRKQIEEQKQNEIKRQMAYNTIKSEYENTIKKVSAAAQDTKSNVVDKEFVKKSVDNYLKEKNEIQKERERLQKELDKNVEKIYRNAIKKEKKERFKQRVKETAIKCVVVLMIIIGLFFIVKIPAVSEIIESNPLIQVIKKSN